MSMQLILHIESSTTVCSVALSAEGHLLNFIDKQSEGYIHGESLTLMIEELFQKAGRKLGDLSAISYSAGPGSYTGLRIGLSTAKGLCYALSIPLIAIPTHDILFEMARAAYPSSTKNIIAMLDARRTEVYLQSFESSGQVISSLQCALLDQMPPLENLPAIVVGDANLKAKDFWTQKELTWLDTPISAKFQVNPSTKAYSEKKFEDTAYCNPIYLKGANGILL